MAFLDVNGLSYFYTKIKSKFALATHTHNAATTSKNGFMSTTDKKKLNGVATGATKNSIIQSTITLTASGWSSKTQSVTITGVTSSNVVIVMTNDAASGIKCTAQSNNTLTFTCDTTPTTNITVDVVILE